MLMMDLWSWNANADDGSMTPSRNDRRYTLRSVQSSPGRSFLFSWWVWGTLNENPRWSTVLMKMLWMMTCSSRVGGTWQHFSAIFILISDSTIRPQLVGKQSFDFISSLDSSVAKIKSIWKVLLHTLKSESAFMEILLENQFKVWIAVLYQREGISY